jgi:hypothetical protein
MVYSQVFMLSVLCIISAKLVQCFPYGVFLHVVIFFMVPGKVSYNSIIVSYITAIISLRVPIVVTILSNFVIKVVSSLHLIILL